MVQGPRTKVTRTVSSRLQRASSATAALQHASVPPPAWRNGGVASNSRAPMRQRSASAGVSPRRIAPPKVSAHRSMMVVAATLCCGIVVGISVRVLGGRPNMRVLRRATDETGIPNHLEYDDDKEPIIQLLRDAGVSNLDQETLDSLPTWSEVTALYGAEPKMKGLETCPTFQQSGDRAEHFLAVAGTFNSGTNLLAELLTHNCHMPARMLKYGKIHEGIRWQVPWGKHTPIDDETVRQGHKTQSGADIPADNVFPAITIRDPAVWAASMCRHEYAVHWPHTKSGAAEQHCPNFVPNKIDLKLDESLTNSTSIPISIEYAEFKREHDSLIHHWNEYYDAYVNQVLFPALVVRFEDLIFHPKQVVETVCNCAGGTMKYKEDNKGFRYIVNSAKKGRVHGKEKTGYVDAIIRYGSDKGRWISGGMTDEDREYVEDYLDRQMMEFFGYQYPRTSSTQIKGATAIAR